MVRPSRQEAVVSEQLRSFDAAQVAVIEQDLVRGGVGTVVGTVVNAAGLTLAKSVPLTGLDAFHRAGLGASPVWLVFCIDGAIAFTETISAVGDLRLRLDLDALRKCGDGLAWAPVEMFDQVGQPVPGCPRGLLRRVEQQLAGVGLEARVGHELEFVLVAPDGSALQHDPWVPYGATGLLDREAFLGELFAAATAAGVAIVQLHCEYGRNQFELSLVPANPVAAADTAVLAKLVVGRTARRHGLRVSFSPVPFPGAVGNGAHLHFSLLRDGASVFGGGDGPHGIAAEGGCAIGGLLRGLPDVQGVLAGSVLSGERVKPGLWSGAHRCWGLENREAAVRFVAGGASNPYGSNVEVKIIDPSANAYLASAAVLALALDGIAATAPLPREVTVDPSKLSEAQRLEAGVTLLEDDMATVIDTLDQSPLGRRLLGDEVVDAVVATRRHEQANYVAKPVVERAELFRLAWTI
jgi:glutamine synthetase